jgi:tetratricopeptide (TPR) repeat protein
MTLIPLGFTLLFEKRQKPFPRLVFSLSIILMFAALIFTGSRSGLIAVAAGITLVSSGIIYLRLRHPRSFPPKHHYFRLPLITLIIMLGCALIFGTRYTPSLSELSTRFQTTPSTTPLTTPPPIPDAPEPVARVEENAIDSGTIRLIVWKGALQVWKRYPFFGSGVETFAYSYYQDRPLEHNLVTEWDFLYNKAHNEFLNFLATTGLFGLLSYLAIFCILTFKSLLFIIPPKNNTHKKILLIGLLSASLSLAISNFFGFSTVACQVLQFLLLALATLIIHPPPSLKIPPPTDYVWWQYLAIFTITLLSVLSLTTVYDYWRADYYYSQGKSDVSRGQSTKGLEYLELAISKNPHEALYYNDLSDFLAQLAVAYQKADQPALATQTALKSKAMLDKTQALNPVHLNFFKTRTRIYLNLAQLDPNYFVLAQTNLQEAMARAPTDPKLVYTYALLLGARGDEQEQEQYMRRVLEMRPVYHEARQFLAALEEKRGQYQAAAAHYQYILDYITANDQLAKQGLARLATLSSTLTTTTAPISPAPLSEMAP